MAKTRGNVKTADVMRESVLKFAVHVARRSHFDTAGHVYPSHISREERQRRDEVREASARLSDEREWALVLSLGERFDVSPLMINDVVSRA